MKNGSDKIYRENRKTYFMVDRFFFFLANRTYEKM